MKYLYALLIISTLIPAASFAGDGSGKIMHIIAHTKVVNGENIGVIMFKVEAHTNQPACSSDEWAFNANDDHGKAMYAMLLSAAAQSKSVSVRGANDCNGWGDRERPYYIWINY